MNKCAPNKFKKKNVVKLWIINMNYLTSLPNDKILNWSKTESVFRQQNEINLNDDFCLSMG